METTLSDVQQELLSLVSADTILLGHSLESDLRALKVCMRVTFYSALKVHTCIYIHVRTVHITHCSAQKESEKKVRNKT